MHGLDVRSRPRSADKTTHVRLANINAYLRWVWPVMPDPLAIEWSDELVLALDGEAPWIFGPVERDPLRGSRGATVLPRRQRARLKGIAASGVPFQRLAIAHELDRDAVQHLLPALQSEPRICSDEVARELVGEVPAHPGVAGSVRLLDGAINGATLSARAPVQLARRVLDPILFGVIAPTPPRHGDLCLWYPLAAWRW